MVQVPWVDLRNFPETAESFLDGFLVPLFGREFSDGEVCQVVRSLEEPVGGLFTALKYHVSPFMDDGLVQHSSFPVLLALKTQHHDTSRG